MGLIFKNNGKEKIFGFTFSFKFGKGSEKQDKCKTLLTSLVTALKAFGVTIKNDDDQSVVKDKKLF